MQWENNKDSTTPALPEADDCIKFHNARFKLASPISGQVPFEKKTQNFTWCIGREWAEGWEYDVFASPPPVSPKSSNSFDYNR